MSLQFYHKSVRSYIVLLKEIPCVYKGCGVSQTPNSIIMSKELIDKIKSPYGVDRYILEEFKKQGFVFDRNRSQYIQYCFGNYAGGKMTVS